MSGGSFNYLYCKEVSELFYAVDDLEGVELYLIKRGDKDIAQDVRRLIEYIRTAENRISVLKENLTDVLHAVEWRESGDWGEESLQRVLDKYRNEEDEEVVNPHEPLKRKPGETEQAFCSRVSRKLSEGKLTPNAARKSVGLIPFGDIAEEETAK